MLGWTVAADRSWEKVPRSAQVVALESADRTGLEPFWGVPGVFRAGGLSTQQQPPQCRKRPRSLSRRVGLRCPVLGAEGLCAQSLWPGQMGSSATPGTPHPVKREGVTFTPLSSLEQIGDREEGQDRQSAPLQPQPCGPETCPSLCWLCGGQGPGSADVPAQVVGALCASCPGQAAFASTPPRAPHTSHSPLKAGTARPASRETVVPRGSPCPLRGLPSVLANRL